ncbi:MAG: M28 family peptidase [Chloroflexota bacterium]|nr:MAG: M28 family peptidase [Chloroflexota bacterium]
MKAVLLAEKADAYLRELCLHIPGRSVGSKGNQAATDFFANAVAPFGFETESPMFECIEWASDGVSLEAGSASFEAFASPYSLGCRISAPLVVVSTVGELETAEVAGRIILLRGDIAKEQLMPKNFPFYNPDSHKRIIQLLEAKKPSAIIAATSRDPEMVGALYPFPLIEDGDFDIPSVYMTEEEGVRLAACSGGETSLESKASRIPARACNVIASKGIASKGSNLSRRVVLFAHIDAKHGTPGALDNASGVVVLLLLARLLENYSGTLGVEIVALNGEDYYSSPGEQQYLAINAGRFAEIALGVNLDGVGYRLGDTAYSMYDCPPAIADTIHALFSKREGMVEGQPWYQGDHGLFLMNQTPALALTSERLAELLAEVIHTPQDSIDMVNTTKLVEVAVALRDLVMLLDR